MRVESGLVLLLDSLDVDPYPSSDEVRGSFSDAMDAFFHKAYRFGE